MIKDLNNNIVILCRDRNCIYNDVASDTCDIDKKINIIKGKCIDKIKTKKEKRIKGVKKIDVTEKSNQMAD